MKSYVQAQAATAALHLRDVRRRAMVAGFSGFAALAALAAVATLLAAPAHAQQIYRSVGADGRVTFSDQPPVAGAQPAGTATGGSAAAGPQLPFELRQAVTRFPVTLYTSAGCSPCQSGRVMLTARGVPFVERIVSSPEDMDALTKLSGETGVPFLTIGQQQIKGFGEGEWTQFLNAAGYPRTSVLPAGYRNPPPTPLVPPPVDAGPVTAPAAPITRPTPAAPALTPANPAGIKF